MARLGSARITNSPAALQEEIARAGRHPRVVLEAAYGWYWAADVLEEAGGRRCTWHTRWGEGVHLPAG